MPSHVEPRIPTWKGAYWLSPGASLDAAIPTLEGTYTLIFGNGHHKINNVHPELGEEIVRDMRVPGKTIS